VAEHLILCGNKTDECLNCRKFIRRAIFAYHYENNCANLDESEAENRPVPQQADTKSKYQSDNASQSSSNSAAANNKNTSIIPVDLGTLPKPHIAASDRSNSDSL
jgi:hypothetical protein